MTTIFSMMYSFHTRLAKSSALGHKLKNGGSLHINSDRLPILFLMLPCQSTFRNFHTHRPEMPSVNIDCKASRRGRRAGKKVIMKEIHQCNFISTHISRETYEKFTHSINSPVNLQNLISVKLINSSKTIKQRSSSKDLLSFCLLNAQSLNNKDADFTDYITDLQAGVVAITETWFTEK